MLLDLLNVLLVEDNPGDARLIREMLTRDVHFGASYALAHVTSLEIAALHCSREHFNVILLDINLPDSTGLDTIQQMSVLAPQTPIVILTGMRDERLAVEAAKYGAQDYINKDECTASLLKRIIHYAIERKFAEEKFKHLAMHDALTGLPNRTLFYDRLTQVLGRAQRDRVGMNIKWKAAILLLDLNRFKSINDSVGHAQGDAVLRIVARRLKFSLRETDTVARLGGDEFILIIEGVASRADCISVSQKLLKALDEPVMLERKEFSLCASIGISIFPDDAQDIEALIHCADTAMYTAKRLKTPFCFYQDRDL